MPRPGTLTEVARVPLLQAIRSAKREILLVAPFVSGPVAAALAKKALASNAKSRRFITALKEGPVRAGFLDPTGLRLLQDSGFEVRSIQNLHAKLAVIDREWGLVGSGNLTDHGLGGKARANVELGVLLRDDQVRAAQRIAQRWWRAADVVTPKVLARYEAIARTDRRGAGGGPGYGSVLDVDQDQTTRDIRRRRSTGLWLKMMYHDTRRDRGEWWRHQPWVSDGRPPPSPTRLVGGPRYAVGDLLVFYLVERGGPLRFCPAIAEIRELPRYDPAFVRANGFANDDRKWPWVSEVRVLHSTSLDAAPRLSDLEVGSTSVRQHGHIVLSERQFDLARRRIVTERST